MEEEFEIDEIQYNFDFKVFFFKLLSFWYLFAIAIGIGLAIAYYINVRKTPVYRMSNMISIKDDQNPFFTSNTSLTFNWGGTTDKVNTAQVILQSRSHNEKTVKRLQFYVNYEQNGEYNKIDVYKRTPFSFVADTLRPQITWVPLEITVIDSTSFNIKANFEDRTYSVLNYSQLRRSNWQPQSLTFDRDYKFDEPVRLPFLNGSFNFEKGKGSLNAKYYLSFTGFYGVVNRYQGIRVEPESKGSSILQLSLAGANKARLVDYLNASVSVLSDEVLNRKNLFATKTIKFIDSSLTEQSAKLKVVEDELNDFKDQNEIFDLNAEGRTLNEKIISLDLRLEAIQREVDYYDILEDYLLTRTNYTDVPAPSVAGIEERSIQTGISKIVNLAEQRSKYEYSIKEGAPAFEDIDRQINAVKDILLENIRSTKSLKQKDTRDLNEDLAKAESEIRSLPKEQQALLKIQRRYNLSQNAYNLFLSKRSEASLVKAANVSDVLVIDSARDTGGGRVGPNTDLNYIIGLLLGFTVPFIIVFILYLIDNKIHTIQDIKKLSKIPLIGRVGKSQGSGNLAVLDNPKSAVSEAFRGIRSSLQFMYRDQKSEGGKVVLISSSVSGEGKTFCSINIASVFALSNKKTILVGLDLRKPKIFGDFNIKNDIGVVNYLIKDATIPEIIQGTQIPDLDIITSGPVPPNPSELLLSERMTPLVDYLKQHYDYIILDSPPLGLVADALQLVEYADANLYVIRHNYTRKGMLSGINEKYKKGEIKNLSFILNYFKHKKHYGYGTGYGYGYGYGYGAYGNGYHETQPKPSFFKRVLKTFKKEKG